MTRRSWGDDGIYWVASRNRYVGATSLGYGPDGKRRRKVVSGRTKQEVKDKLRELHENLAASVQTSKRYTVGQAIDDWLSQGMEGRSPQTIAKYRNVLKSIIEQLGRRVLADLTAAEVRTALTRYAQAHATETVGIARLGLERAIRHAEANGLVRRNVAALVDAPHGKSGRPSKALNMDQAAALIKATGKEWATAVFPGSPPRPPELMRAFVVVCLLVGLRTEEARALRWDHVHLDGQPDADPPLPPHIEIWRSVRAHGDTKTEKSRRTLGLPGLAVDALRAQLRAQDDDKAAALELWQDRGLVFATKLGTSLDAGNVRRMFKNVCKAAGIGTDWTPRELRTSFVSLMSQQGVSNEEIARLVGHSSTRVTETVYRRELRPVITTGAEVMDQVFVA